MFFRKAPLPAAPLPPELRRMVDAWPEMSERTRFGLLMLSSASLLKNLKLRPGLATLGSGLRFEAGVVWRDTRRQLGSASRRLASWLRP